MSTELLVRGASPAAEVATRVIVMVDLGTFTPFYDLELAAALRAEGWRVELVMPEYEFESVAPGGTRPWRTSLLRLPHGRRRRHLGAPRQALRAVLYMGDLIRLDRLLARLSPSLVHVQWAHLPWLDRILWRRWRAAGWKVVYTAHDATPLDGTTPPLLAGSYASLVDRADAVVVHSEVARASLVDAGATPGNVHVIPPASPFTPGPGTPGREEARRDLGLASDARVILFFGFLKPYKGLSVLLHSLPAIKRATGLVKLVIAGEAMEPTAGYDREIVDLGLSDDVDWRPGFVPASQVAALFAAADVVALPYLDASSSGVLLTAYACRRPVVASAVGGLPDLVVPGTTGATVPPGDPAALAASLAELLADPQLAARMGESAHRLSLERYTWSGMARQLDELYGELLRPHSKS